MTTEPVEFATQSPGDFMAASAKKSLSGNTSWATGYASELRRVLAEHAAWQPRTLQSHLGPSELGVACDRQVAGKIAAIPATNHVADFWPSLRGTYCHAGAADAFDADNERHDLLRWITEQKVTPHPDHPGTADLYDALEQAVVDHKFLSESTMVKIRKGWPRHYRVQLILYGLGYLLLGLPVRRIVLAAYPASAGTLDGIYLHEEALTLDGYQLLPEIAALLEEVFEDTERRKGQAAEIIAGRIDLMDVPAVPDSDGCYFCPFYRPQAAKDSGPGCPGSTAAKTTAPSPA